MKAIIQTVYGSSDLFKIEDVPQPVQGANEVLTRVHAAAVNYYDQGHAGGRVIIKVKGEG